MFSAGHTTEIFSKFVLVTLVSPSGSSSEFLRIVPVNLSEILRSIAVKSTEFLQSTPVNPSDFLRSITVNPSEFLRSIPVVSNGHPRELLLGI